MSANHPPENSSEGFKPRYIDIGINLTDPVYTGLYHGTQRHPSDLSGVLDRARAAGCQKLIVTGSDLEESRKAFALAQDHPGFIYHTVGVHPCSSLPFSTSTPTTPHDSATTLLSSLRTLALSSPSSPSSTNPIVAFGEIGLDYDRLTLCPADVQRTSFSLQLDLAASLSLPLFLHSRAAHADFIAALKPHLHALPRRGVVHSFTGTMAEMLELVELGFDIGINGCSMKTPENVDVVRAVPLERIQLETDGPWCEMRPSHASAGYVPKGTGEAWKSVKKEKWVEGAMVKGRNEPCTIGSVAVAVAAIKGVEVEVLTEAAWRNTVRMFGLGEEVVAN